MTEYDQKQSKEIYESLLDSKVDLLEYFLGPDPKKTSYYKKHVKRYRAQSILNDFYLCRFVNMTRNPLPIGYNRSKQTITPLSYAQN